MNWSLIVDVLDEGYEKRSGVILFKVYLHSIEYVSKELVVLDKVMHNISSAREDTEADFP